MRIGRLNKPFIDPNYESERLPVFVNNFIISFLFLLLPISLDVGKQLNSEESLARKSRDSPTGARGESAVH